MHAPAPPVDIVQHNHHHNTTLLLPRHTVHVYINFHLNTLLAYLSNTNTLSAAHGVHGGSLAARTNSATKHTPKKKCQQHYNNKISKLYSQRTNKAAQGEASRHPKYVRCHVPFTCVQSTTSHTPVSPVLPSHKLQLICLQSTHTHASACRWCPCLFSSILQSYTVAHGRLGCPNWVYLLVYRNLKRSQRASNLFMHSTERHTHWHVQHLTLSYSIP